MYHLILEDLMAIKKKPKADQTSLPTIVDGAAFDAYLDRGGSVTVESTHAPKKDVRFTLTIPADLCEQLDTLRQRLPIKTARHKWVLEAILEKIQRDVANS